MAGTTSIIAQVKELSHQAAEDLCSLVTAHEFGRTVVLDLNATENASTAAFARLVLLRRDLLKKGRDLRLSGLRDRAASIYRISKLNAVLPLL
jgi:anti-anti-sigma regulatory factor